MRLFGWATALMTLTSACDDASAPTVIVPPVIVVDGGGVAQDGSVVDARLGDAQLVATDMANNQHDAGSADAMARDGGADLRPDQGALSADAAPPDAAIADECPPNPIEGEWAGDLHLRAACGVQVFGRPEVGEETYVRVGGDLRIDSGVEVHVVRSLTVMGNLEIGAGAQMLCEPRWLVGNGSTFLNAVGTESRVRGTAEAPVIFGRLNPPVSSQNACHLRRIVGTIEHANFHSVGFLGLGGTIRDSIVDNAHINAPGVGARTWLSAADQSTFEYCRFHRTQIQGEYTVRFSHFDRQGYEPIVSVGDERCEGVRDQAQTVFVEHNVFDIEDGDEVFRLGRGVGAVSYPNNHFVNGVPDDADVWDGRDRRGCDDDLGEWGGPLSLDPILAEPPAVYGPRR